MTDAPATTPDKKPAPWRGRRRVMDVKEKFIAVRVTVEDRSKIADAADEEIADDDVENAPEYVDSRR